MAIFKHFSKLIYSRATLSKMADFVDEIEINKIINTTEIFPPLLTEGKERGSGYGVVAKSLCANFNGVIIASHLCMCLRRRWFSLDNATLTLRLLLHLLRKKNDSYSCASPYNLFASICHVLHYRCKRKHRSAGIQMCSFILWSRLALVLAS